jgi:hypothetical protein
MKRFLQRIYFKNKRSLLFKIVVKYLIVPEQKMKRFAWQQLLRHYYIDINGNNNHNYCYYHSSSIAKRPTHPSHQSLLYVSQAGQSLLFGNTRPLSLAVIRNWIQHQLLYQRKLPLYLPRLEIIKSHIWDRFVSPFETAENQYQRKLLSQRRKLMFQKLLQQATSSSTASSNTMTIEPLSLRSSIRSIMTTHNNNHTHNNHHNNSNNNNSNNNNNNDHHLLHVSKRRSMARLRELSSTPTPAMSAAADSPLYEHTDHTASDDVIAFSVVSPKVHIASSPMKRLRYTGMTSEFLQSQHHMISSDKS